jgi:hypothetical protein
MESPIRKAGNDDLQARASVAPQLFEILSGKQADSKCLLKCRPEVAACFNYAASIEKIANAFFVIQNLQSDP